MGIGVVRLQAQRLAEMSERLFRPALSVEGDGKVIMRLGERGSKRERATEVSRGFLETLLVPQDVSQVVAGVGAEGSSASACRKQAAASSNLRASSSTTARLLYASTYPGFSSSARR